jgi:hypothetical protein
VRQLRSRYVGDASGKCEKEILGIIHPEFVLRIKKYASLEENRRKTEYEGKYVNMETHNILFVRALK